jgi:hypothetical protein
MPRIHQFVTVATFRRVLGAVYLAAFLSFGAQAPGLIGSHGILPFADYLQYFHKTFGAAAYRYVPTVLWLAPSNWALAAVWIAGAVCAAVAIAGRFERAALAICLVLWLSLVSVGQDFLGFQWDALLIETGFLALFADRSLIRVWLFRWLLFRLIFSSGVVKLASHDAVWRNLTALHYHYETQPLPTPLAWFFYQFPMWFQRASTMFVFIAELAVPFLFFLPRRPRLVGAWFTITLQVLILATGNYTFFNFLTIALTMWLFIEPEKRERHWADLLSAALAVFIGIVSGLIMLQTFSLQLPEGGAEILHAVAPFQAVNSYGLFAVMTTERDEIIVEGSNDGVNWRDYEFRYKPGNVYRAPPVVEPYQPRLDWQMWFAALGSYRENRWFVGFVVRLLQGEHSVTRLLTYDPFAGGKPKYVRAVLYRYEFTHLGQRGWWARQPKGMYLPPVSLK